MNTDGKQQISPKLEELRAPAAELSAEESAAVTGGMKNARKAKRTEAVSFVPPTDLADD